MIGSAADTRQDQWLQAASYKFDDIINELYEADSDECTNMAGLIGSALKIISDAGPVYSEESATTAMCMWEWFLTSSEFCRDHFKHPEGACATRDNFLQHAHVLDEAWSIANKEHGYDDAFDWEFVPDFMGWVVQLSLEPYEMKDHIPTILEAMGVIK